MDTLYIRMSVCESGGMNGDGIAGCNRSAGIFCRVGMGDLETIKGWIEPSRAGGTQRAHPLTY